MVIPILFDQFEIVVILHLTPMNSFCLFDGILLELVLAKNMASTNLLFLYCFHDESAKLLLQNFPSAIFCFGSSAFIKIVEALKIHCACIWSSKGIRHSG